MLAQSGDSQWAGRLAFWMRSDLRNTSQRIATISETLGALPELTQINSSASIGFKTAYMPDEEELWVEITLPKTEQVNAVVLVPPLAKGASGVVSGYGFPTRFKIDAFDEQDAMSTVLDATAQDFPNRGGYPVLATFNPMPVKRVRLTATEPWQRDGPPVLALAEMLILSGERNVAAGGKVACISDAPGEDADRFFCLCLCRSDLPPLNFRVSNDGCRRQLRRVCEKCSVGACPGSQEDTVKV